jgi:hypothetical protein
MRLQDIGALQGATGLLKTLERTTLQLAFSRRHWSDWLRRDLTNGERVLHLLLQRQFRLLSFFIPIRQDPPG